MIRVAEDGTISATCSSWIGFSVAGLRPHVEANGKALLLQSAKRETLPDGIIGAEYRFSEDLTLSLAVVPAGQGAAMVKAIIRNGGQGYATLNRVWLLSSSPDQRPKFGSDPAEVVMLTQAAYWGQVTSLQPSATAALHAAEPGGGTPPPVGREWTSQDVWEVYDRLARQAMLVGFCTSERFAGTISATVASTGAVEKWAVGFDAGDLVLPAGGETALEEVLLLQGPDPLRLLEDYGDAVARRHAPRFPSSPPVSWCSWYPYRLGVTEERILAEARLAASRLKPLGLSIMEVDLGWEKDQLPSSFAENRQFPSGLKRLSEELTKLGFVLGCWKGPFSISEFDDLARQHPQWLVQGQDGNPVDAGTWFWPPHGKTHLLDLTHPEARQWLQENFASLRQRGVRYFKGDFIGQVGCLAAKTRHDPRMVLGGGNEARRLAAEIIRQELGEDCLQLTCGGPEMPGRGHWPLLYAANDTGNTGHLNWSVQQKNFQSIACHLWKNRRWGIIQPSCLCVGLPGTLEEARIRATVAFLAGGQVDISDTLTSLPEDRWAVLEATLPPLGISARAIDLFEPIDDPGSKDYVAVCKGQAGEAISRPHPPGSVWHLPVERPWDGWDLVACFAVSSQGDKLAPVRFSVPLSRLGLDGNAAYSVYEFWSGQFLGAVGEGRTNPRGYEHPGDLQDLQVGHSRETLEIAFTPPAVKLLCLRRARPHPWIVGTSFHQSCGAELAEVRWDSATNALTGRLLRPAGASGYLLVNPAGHGVKKAKLAGRATTAIPSAGGAWRVPVLATSDSTEWQVLFTRR